MTVITRISRLFRADLHGILDCIEEPLIVLKQAVREMECEIQEGEAELSRREASKQQLEAKAAGRSRALKELEHQIDLCFEAENEALVKSLVRKKLETKKTAGILEQALARAQSEIEALSSRLSEQREKLERVAEKMEMLADTAPAASGGGSRFDDYLEKTDYVVTDQDVEVAYLEEKKRREEAR